MYIHVHILVINKALYIDSCKYTICKLLSAEIVNSHSIDTDS